MERKPQAAPRVAGASDLHLRSIVDSAMDAIVTVDGAYRITLFNRAAERIFGYAASEVLGQGLDRLIPERFRKDHPEQIASFGRTGVDSRPMGHPRVVSALRKSGEEFPIDSSISQVVVDGERLFTIILRDVSRRVRAESELARTREDLRELAVASRTAREQENSRISRELHDELGQNLTSLKMDLAWLEQSLAGAGEPVRQALAGMRAVLDSTVAATRRIAADLRPLLLDDLGLKAALEWLAQELERRYGFTIELAVAESCARLPEPHASQVFRVVQESLTNVARHSGATKVTVKLERRGGELHLEVRDNGRGISAAEQEKKGSFGLVGIRERVYMLDGRVDIKGTPGHGTRIAASIPLPEAPREAA